MDLLTGYKLPKDCSLGLKVVWADGRPEYGLAPKDFRWNLKLGAETEAPDWDSTPVCGGGLHIWERGHGRLGVSDIWYQHPDDAVWLAVEYKTSSAVGLNGKIKVPRCRTVAVSPDRKEILEFVQVHHPPQGKPLFEVAVVDEGEVTVGDGGVAIVRGKGTAYACGLGGIALAGDGGTAIALKHGAASVGKGGYASVGDGGKAKAGEGGILCFCDDEYAVGENGIKPNTFYRRIHGVLTEVKG